MEGIYIVAAIVAGLVVAFVMLAILWMCKRVAKNVRGRAVELISDYDSMIEKKSQEVLRLNGEIDEQREQLTQLNKTMQEAAEATPSGGDDSVSPTEFLRAMERVASTEYREMNIGEIYMDIKRNFRQDPLEKIRALVNQDLSLMNVSTGIEKKMLAELDFETVYELSSLPEEEQKNVLISAMSEEEKQVMAAFLAENRTFHSLTFYDWLKTRSLEDAQKFELYIPLYDEKRVYPSYVNVHTDESIIEGFRLVIRGKVYDYSIKYKDLS